MYGINVVNFLLFLSSYAMFGGAGHCHNVYYYYLLNKARQLLGCGGIFCWKSLTDGLLINRDQIALLLIVTFYSTFSSLSGQTWLGCLSFTIFSPGSCPGLHSHRVVIYNYYNCLFDNITCIVKFGFLTFLFSNNFTLCHISIKLMPWCFEG